MTVSRYAGSLAQGARYIRGNWRFALPDAVILDTDGLYRKIWGKNEENPRSPLDPYAGRRYYALKFRGSSSPWLSQSQHHAVLASTN
jgi:hypothetical protein